MIIKTTKEAIIQIYKIIGTSIWIAQAWEPDASWAAHATITHFDNGWYGRVGTERNNPNPERGYSLIIQAFPCLELYPITKTSGEIQWQEL